MRRVLAVKAGGPWLVLVDDRWEIEGGQPGAPFERARIALLPLLERPRDEVEREARGR